MTVDDQTTTSRSEARAFFAERLRTLRIPRGFRTARSFAKALDIDENRYTRYERAEVEPDLSLIRRICVMLGVSPNELLGLPNGANCRAFDNAPIGSYDEPSTARSMNVSLPMIAWAISGLIANARYRRQSDSEINLACPEEFLREAGSIYASILKSPNQTVEALAKDQALLTAGPEANREFVSLRAQLSWHGTSHPESP